MDIFSNYKQQKFRKLIPFVLIGIGFIILGLAGVNLLINHDEAKDYSVVPQVVDFPAPELTLNDLHGGKVTISDYQPKIVMINNWATWCPPCKAEMPILSRYYQEHTNQGFILIGIEAGDPVEEVAKFVEENELNFPILLDPNEKSLILFHNDNLPSSYIIDSKGNVILAWTGPISRAMLEKYVTPLLEQ